MTERRSLALMLALAALFFIAGLALLPVPFTRDQGIYAYVAWQWLSGAPPYLGSFDHKGPLLYLVYGAALQVSHGAMWGPNLFDALARTAAVMAAWLLGRRLSGPRAGLYAAALTSLPLLGVFNSCWWNAQAETFMLPLLGFSAGLALDPRRRPAAFFAAGFLAAQAAMLKPTGLMHGAFLVGWVALAPIEGGRRPRDAGWVAAGLGFGVLVWVIYFTAVGALGAMWETLVVFNTYHGAASLASVTRPVGTFIQGTWVVFSWMPVLLPLLLLRRPEAERRGFAAWFLLVSFFQVAVQARFFLYHWLTLVPAVGLAAGLGLDRLRATLSARLRPAAGVAAAVLALVFFGQGYIGLWRLVIVSYRTDDFIRGRIGLAEYYARFSEAGAAGRGDFSLLASAAAADYLRKHTPEGAEALIFGYEPLVNYLSARPSPTRFQIDYPLTFQPRSAAAAARREKWRKEFLAELSAHPPVMVVLMDNDRNAIEPESSVEQARQFGEFWEWLTRHYERTDRIEDFTFYRRK